MMAQIITWAGTALTIAMVLYLNLVGFFWMMGVFI